MTLEKVLKRGKHNRKTIRTASLVSVLDSETSFSLFFLNGLRLRSVAWLATPASRMLHCCYERFALVTMAATLAADSGGRTSQLLK